MLLLNTLWLRKRLVCTNRRPCGLRKTTMGTNSLAHRTTWLRSDFSLWISIQSSPRSSWRFIRCNSFCGVFDEIPWIVGLWSRLSMNNIWISSEFFYVWLVIFASLFELSVWFGLLDWSFLQWEKCLALGSILRCSVPVIERETTHIVLLPSRTKRWGLYHIAWIYPSTSCHLA